MQKNIENFEFYEKNTINDMLINKENSAFCYNCYYFIVVKGDPSVKEDLVIISDDNPIPLKDGTNFKDKVKASEKKEYELYSTSTFILNMNILYGNVTINVFDPKDRIVVNQTLTLSK